MIYEKILHLVVQKNLHLPDKLVKEVWAFVLRNMLIMKVQKNGKEHRIREVCHRCLKAYIAKTAREMALLENRNVKNVIEQIHDETGHNGYYLDNGQVVNGE